ncbi:MAG: hypothetical protein NT043_05480 [Candidatus Bathyarchaeota archaeon]|nr:hypothetical protein [Candidatus Bathyarchaeota archaeon]
MKTHNLENILDSINLRKLAKPSVLCINALFILSMLPALHTSGHTILDADNNGLL